MPQPALTRQGATPRSAQVVTAPRQVAAVVAPPQGRVASVLAREARQAVERPTSARVAPRWHPSWALPGVRRVALGQARAAGAASKAVTAVAPPMSALRAAPVQASARPTSARPAVPVAGEPRRQERHPRREQVQRRGWVAEAAARPARPMCPGPTLREPAGPS